MSVPRLPSPLPSTPALRPLEVLLHRGRGRRRPGGSWWSGRGGALELGVGVAVAGHQVDAVHRAAPVDVVAAAHRALEVADPAGHVEHVVVQGEVASGAAGVAGEAGELAPVSLTELLTATVPSTGPK